jgi:tetratricopeptide (TPR) repeat protein
MSPPSSPQVHSTRRRPMIIATILLLGCASATGLWLCRDILLGPEPRIVRRALAQGRLDQAAQAVQRWLRSSPDSAEAHYFKARIAWAQNDLAATDQGLARAHALGYDPAPLARLRGLLLVRANQMSEAEPLLRQAWDGAHQPDPEVAEALTRLYLGAFRLGEAAAVIDRWMRGSPDDGRPYLLQTEIDKRSNAEPTVIIGHYRAALERDPSLDQARFGLARQLRLNHRNAEAATEYTAYLCRKPGDPSGYASAGQNALEMGDLVEAARLLERALVLAPHDSEVLAGRATLELRQGHLDAALDYFNQAVKADPFDHWNRYQRMLILARLGKRAEAEAERQAVERLKNDQARFGQISRDLLRNPLDPQLRGEAARWLMEHGHADEAIEWANLVLRSDPSHPAMNRLLADYYRKRGQLGLANFHETHAEKPPDHANSTR